MNKTLELHLLNFLKTHIDPQKPVLLGLSGGVDSMTLFHLFLNSRLKFPFVFYAIYIDHGWREDSKEEAKQLKQLCEKENVPFRTTKLNLSNIKGNLEDLCRQERLSFFEKMYKKVKAGALFLAHQKEDLAETVLKRVFEGGSLFNLVSLKEESSWNGMRILRPLLGFEKKDLVKYLEAKGKPWYEDSTNSDPKYLRSRMRKEIFPELEGLFGKKITGPLASLSAHAGLIEEYLSLKVKPYLLLVKEATYGTLFDFSPHNLHLIEVQWVLKELFRSKNTFISQRILDLSSQAIVSEKADQMFYCQGLYLYIDRKKLVLTPFEWVEFKLHENLSDKIINCDTYSYEISVADFSKASLEKKDWIECWGEGYDAFVPSKPVALIPYSKAKEDKDLEKRLERLKLPIFVKRFFPYLLCENGKAYDFFSAACDLNSLLVKLIININ